MAAVASALLAAGCGGNGDDGAGSPASAAANAQTAGATLRADLAARLADQTFLTGAAIAEAVRGGIDQPQFAAAVAAAKVNAGALAGTVAGVYGAGPRDELARLWREQVDAFAAYAKAKLAADEDGVQQALTDLDSLRTTTATQLVNTIGKLDRAQTAEDMRLQIQALIAAADAIIAKDRDAYAKLGDAGARAPIDAERLANAIAADKPDRFTAKPDGPAAAMRAGLTARLVADSYLTLLQCNAIVRFGGESGTARGAGAGVDKNAVAFSQLLSSVYGEDAGQRTLELWREQARLLAGYSQAKARKDDIAARTALSGLDMWREELAKLLVGFNPRLDAGLLADALRLAIDARTAVVRADGAHSTKTFVRTQEAAAAAAGLATVLARGISAQYPDRFGAE